VGWIFGGRRTPPDDAYVVGVDGEEGTMSEACRFSHMDGPCWNHGKYHADICDLGLAALRARLAAVLEGQVMLADQTVRIRRALGVPVDAEGDTEDYAKELRTQLNDQARVIGRLRELLNCITVSKSQPCLSLKAWTDDLERRTVFFYYTDMEDQDGVAREVLNAFEAERETLSPAPTEG
jgi:hypothetical protein